MRAVMWGTGEVVELLEKGMTTRRGHWHRYGSALKWVQTHPLTYHEGAGGQPRVPSGRHDKENPQQGTLFDMVKEFQKKHKVRLVVPVRRDANLHQQFDLFAKREEQYDGTQRTGI